MRVIAGDYKGRRIISPEGRDIRPTTDKTKEAIFSILTGRIAGSSVLDLFSGTGALGIEALSRGADLCVFCEKAREALGIIEENLINCGIAVRRISELSFEEKDEPLAYICPGDITKSLEKITGKFEIILMDPPYEKGLCEKSLEMISEQDLLAEDGMIVCEHRKQETLADEICGFVKVKERRYGISMVSIYRAAEF